MVLVGAALVMWWVTSRRAEPVMPIVPGLSERGTAVPTSGPAATVTIAPTATPVKANLAEPVGEFKPRITKKFFGTYITPQNSPVSPERFTGYHTGVDVEYTDVTGDVPVSAVADGTVVVSRIVSGYGGVIIIRHTINGQTLYGVYGHLRPTSLAPVNTVVSRGRQIAVLGTGYTAQTDGERHHLHFALAKANTLAGYVSIQSALSGWLDPLSLY